MSTAVDVRLVPELEPPARAGLPRRAVVRVLPPDAAVGGADRADPGAAAGGTDAGAAVGATDPGATVGGTDPGATVGGTDPGAAVGATVGGTDPGASVGGTDPGTPVDGTDPGAAPAATGTPGTPGTPSSPGPGAFRAPRRAPARRGADRPEPPVGACRPVAERLGTGSLATYTHVAPPHPAGGGPLPVPVPAPGGADGGHPSLDPRQACCMVALAAVEVLCGTRPLAQLARWVTPEVYDALARRAALSAPRTRVLDPLAAPADLRAADGAPVRRPSVRRVRACAAGPHAVEASVVVSHADRVRAVAVRLTRGSGRWRASALVVG